MRFERVFEIRQGFVETIHFQKVYILIRDPWFLIYSVGSKKSYLKKIGTNCNNNLCDSITYDHFFRTVFTFVKKCPIR